MPHGKFGKLSTLPPLLLAGWVASPTYAQTPPNPFQSLKDALNKVIKQVPGRGQPQTPQTPPGTQPNQPAAQPGAAPVSSGGAAPLAASPTSTGGQPWTPPAEADAPAPFKGPLEPAKLPDIGGVHIGENGEPAMVALKKIHPGAQFSALPQSPNLPPAGATLYFESGHPLSWDNTSVTLTWDSMPQIVYSIYRAVRYQPNISKQNLLDALRQKYGKETGASDESYLEAKDDLSIKKMWWLMDEQGHVQHPSRFDPITHSPWGCIQGSGGSEGVSAYRTMTSEYVSGRLPAAKFCDSLIVLYAEFDRGSAGGLDLVNDSRITLSDAALLRRSAIAIGDAQMAQAHKQQQNDLKKANEAKPNL